MITIKKLNREKNTAENVTKKMSQNCDKIKRRLKNDTLLLMLRRREWEREMVMLMAYYFAALYAAVTPSASPGITESIAPGGHSQKIHPAIISH